MLAVHPLVLTHGAQLPPRTLCTEFDFLAFRRFHIRPRMRANVTSAANQTTASSISLAGIDGARLYCGGLAIPGTAANLNAKLAATARRCIVHVSRN